MLRHHRPVVCLAIAPVFLLAGCGEQATGLADTGGGLSDPGVRPAVVSNYPPDGAIGPFQGFSPVRYRAPHFIVQLNKLVHRYAFRPAWIRVEGFRRPVQVVVSSAIGPESSLLYVLEMAVVDPGGFSPVPYEVGTTYTVVVDTSLTDITARHLARPYRFSFTPEPFFRVLSVTPGDGDGSVVSGATLAVEFNSPVHADIGAALQITPPVIGSWSVSANDANVVRFVHAEPFAFSTRYTLEVLPSAADALGHRIQAPWTSSFRARGFEVAGRSPDATDAAAADVFTSVGVFMSGGVDTSSVRSAFHIEPPVPGRLSIGGWAFYLQPASELHSATTYTVTIANTLRAEDGTTLAAPYAYTFTTTPFSVRGEAYPRDFAPLELRMDCTAEVDSASAVAAFSIDPPVSGSVRCAPGRRFTFVLEADFVEHVTYTATVTTALRSRAGARLAAPFVFSFTPGDRP